MSNKSKIWRQKQKQLGNCTVCGSVKSNPQRSLCENCLLNQREKREEYKKNNKCLDCAKNKPREGCVRCENCLKQRRDKKAKKILLGICENCNNPIVVGCTQCQDCLNKRKNRKRHYVSNGICPNCEKKPSYKKGCCRDCLDNLVKIKSDRRKRMVCDKCEQQLFLNHSVCKTCYLKQRCWMAIGTNKFWEEIEILFNKQNGLCPYSGLKLTLGVDADIDHIKPKSLGGADDLDNIQWVHYIVNKMKWNSTETDFLHLVKKIYEYRNLENLN